MTSPFFQSLDPMAAPSPITPMDGPSDAAGWAEVTPHGMGPASYDISGPQDIAGIEAAVQAAMNLSGGAEGSGPGAGIPDRHSPRQMQAEAILESPQGADSSNVFAGFPDYENADLRPSELVTPIQGAGTYPGTLQEGVPMYGAQEGAGIEGVPPGGGNMGPAAPGYPGTTQDGLAKYGTS